MFENIAFGLRVRRGGRRTRSSTGSMSSSSWCSWKVWDGPSRPSFPGAAPGRVARRAGAVPVLLLDELFMRRREGPHRAARQWLQPPAREEIHVTSLLRHARPGGGLRGRRPGRRHEPRQDRAGRRAGRDLRASGEPVFVMDSRRRERVPRRVEGDASRRATRGRVSRTSRARKGAPPPRSCAHEPRDRALERTRLGAEGRGRAGQPRRGVAGIRSSP